MAFRRSLRWRTWSRRRSRQERSMSTLGVSVKITGEHLERLAIVYVRQSTLAQVRDHGESTQRQYALSDDAERMGWPAERVLVIDADLGVSGRGGSARVGFKELVGRVCCGLATRSRHPQTSCRSRTPALERAVGTRNYADTNDRDNLQQNAAGRPAPSAP